MNDYWGVDSLHINVGDGDCTVHLLVKFSPGDGGKTPSRVIEKAVLVDTGPANAIRSGNQIIIDSFASIAARYE